MPKYNTGRCAVLALLIHCLSIQRQIDSPLESQEESYNCYFLQGGACVLGAYHVATQSSLGDADRWTCYKNITLRPENPHRCSEMAVPIEYLLFSLPLLASTVACRHIRHGDLCEPSSRECSPCWVWTFPKGQFIVLTDVSHRQDALKSRWWSLRKTVSAATSDQEVA